MIALVYNPEFLATPRHLEDVTARDETRRYWLIESWTGCN
jgi:hypothetical protein